MGIKQLFSIIKEEAPDAIKEGEIKHQFGRKVAIVSSQFVFHEHAHQMLIVFRMRSSAVSIPTLTVADPLAAP